MTDRWLRTSSPMGESLNGRVTQQLFKGAGGPTTSPPFPVTRKKKKPRSYSPQPLKGPHTHSRGAGSVPAALRGSSARSDSARIVTRPSQPSVAKCSAQNDLFVRRGAGCPKNEWGGKAGVNSLGNRRASELKADLCKLGMRGADNIPCWGGTSPDRGNVT